MKEIKTVALVGLGAIGAYFADRLQPMLGDDLRVIAGGARAERIRREGLVINGKQEYYHVVEPGEGEPADLVIFATKMSGLQQAIEDVRAQIGPETLILSPLNGVEQRQGRKHRFVRPERRVLCGVWREEERSREPVRTRAAPQGTV